MKKTQKEFQFSELSIHELQITFGGNIWIRAFEGAVAVYDAVSDFIDGFRYGWNEAKKRHNNK